MNELTSSGGISALLHTGEGLPEFMNRDIFLTEQVVVGTRYLGGAEELVKQLVPGSRVQLFHEADNRFDQNAVLVMDENDRKLGYLPRQQNAIVAALLDAGKVFYGLIKEQPRRIDQHHDTAPYQFVMDLYMREYQLPGDHQGIPRHGAQSSYIVLALNEIDDADDAVFGIYALKVINGEERGHFYRESPKQEDREKTQEIMKGLDTFIGHLPLIGHALTEMKLQALGEAYGVFLGKPLSNLVIDTAQMARVHMPRIRNATLSNYEETLGLSCESASELERECRIVWQLYRQMERSEMRTKKQRPVRLLTMEELAESGRIRYRTFRVLERAGIILLGDLIDRSYGDVMRLRNLGRVSMEELSALLQSYDVSFSDIDYEAAVITLNLDNTDLSKVRDMAYDVLLGHLEIKDLEELLVLTEDERAERITGVVDDRLDRLKKAGYRDTAVKCLLLSGFVGYKGDFAKAAFAMFNDKSDEMMSIVYLAIGLFYEAWHKGKLYDEVSGSMMKACVYLGEAILFKRLEGVELSSDDRRGASSVLLREAITHAAKAPATMETAAMLMTIGDAFRGGSYIESDGQNAAVETDLESAYKAYYYADRYGAPTARRNMEEIWR